MKKAEIYEKVDEGWIRVNMMFEIVGNPKEHIEQALKTYMENIKTDSGVEVLEEDYAPAEEINDGLFSTFVEADMLINGLEKLTWLCYNFTPASIEITDPDEFTFKANELQNWVNDLLSKLHEVGTVSKQISAQNKLLAKNMNRLVKNSMLMAIDMGFDTPKTIEERIGIPYKQLKPFFEALMREGKLTLDENQYKKTKSSKKLEKKKSKAKKGKKKKK